MGEPNPLCYHTDLFSESGFEFIWTESKHLLVKMVGNFSIHQNFLTKILKKIKYQHVKDPIYDNDNNLINYYFEGWE